MRYVLSSRALARTRLAISPLAELLGTLMSAERRVGSFAGPRMLENDRRTLRAFRTWREQTPQRAGFVDLLSHTKLLPDAVGIVPPADGPARIAAELGQIATTDPQVLLGQLQESTARAWTPQDLAWTDHPDLPHALAGGLWEAWSTMVAPDWEQRRRVLDREIAFRTARVATGGWSDALEDMGRNVGWEDPGVLIHAPRVAGTVEVDDHFCFVPITQTDGNWMCELPAGHALVYGARGARAPADRDRARALGRLIGTGRAAVLLALDMPATPTGLHEDLDLALGSVGGHLKVLADAGLVVKARTARQVYYRRSELGEQLVVAAGTGRVQGSDL
jgi:DNA-binding transcriptional ArsR family regulator